jgi:hypothetical protein
MNAQQRVIDRPLELAAVDDHVVVERQNRREGLLFALDHSLTALAQRVEKENPALRTVVCIFKERIGGLRQQKLGRECRKRHRGLPCRLDVMAGSGLHVMRAQMAEQSRLFIRIVPVLPAGLQQALPVMCECSGAGRDFSQRRLSARNVIAAIDVMNVTVTLAAWGSPRMPLRPRSMVARWRVTAQPRSIWNQQVI